MSSPAEEQKQSGKCCRNCFTKYEKFFESIFERIGVIINCHPVSILVTCIIVNCALMSGFLRFESENNVEVLYTPENSQSFQDREYLRNTFQDSTAANFQPYQLPDLGRYAEVIIISGDRSNINSTSILTEIRQIDKFIKKSISIKDNDGSNRYYEDLCAAHLGKCGVLGDIVLSLDFEKDFLSEKVSFPIYKGSLLSPILANAISVNGTLVSTIGVKLRYYLRQDSLLSSKWESRFLENIILLKTNFTDISYATSESLGEELEKNTNGDIQFFSLTFTLMLTYACLASSSSFVTCNNVANRIMLGLGGVLAPILGIGSALGAVSAIGVKFTSIVGVMPFLVVGIGIDDMFILMSGMAEAPPLSTASTSIEDRMKYMLKKSGVAITITSITDLLAFTIGATSVFVGIRNFCIYTGVAVFFCYLNQLLFLCPIICLNERRTQQKRHFLCCFRTKSKEFSNSCGHKFFCTGSIPEKRDEVESFLEKYPKSFAIRFLLKPLFGKFFTFVLFLAYIGGAIYGSINLQQGLSLNNLVSDNSYFYTYSVWDENYFTTEPIIALCITSTKNYSSWVTQSQISSVLSNVLDDQNIDQTFKISWLQSYQNSSFYNITSEENFVVGLKKFMKYFPQFSNDVAFPENQSRISSSKLYIKAKNIKSTAAQGVLLKHLRSISDNAAIPCLFYTPAFIFYEQYIQIWPSTLQTVGVALAVMFFITVVFMPHPLMVCIVMVTLLSILTGIFGFMYIWDLTLSSITMIHLVMSVGFSVDFSVHVCHAFLAVRSDMQTEILQKAFDKAGGPIFNAAFSSLLGISMLSLSQSYIFQSFGKVMFLVIGFGLVHAALFLPLVLSIVFLHLTNKNDDIKLSEFHPNKKTSAIDSNVTDGNMQKLHVNFRPMHISKINALIEDISGSLNIIHRSNFFEKKRVMAKIVRSVGCTYPIYKGKAYTYKQIAIYLSSNNEACYWDFTDSS